MRIASLNLCAYPNRGWRPALGALLAEERPDIVLLQEVRPSWVKSLAEATGLRFIHSHTTVPRLERRPPDGVAIGVSPSAELVSAWHLDPRDFGPANVGAVIAETTPRGHEALPEALGWRYAARTLFAELVVDGINIVVASFHATPGTSLAGVPGRKHQKVDEWKPFFHGAAAIALASLPSPFVFAIDANEPNAETGDSITFHWSDNRAGVRKLQALLGDAPLHSGRDLLREQVNSGIAVAESDDCLACTHVLRGSGARRRFDHVWATPTFVLDHFAVYLDRAIAAGTDHALVVADLSLPARDA